MSTRFIKIANAVGDAFHAAATEFASLCGVCAAKYRQYWEQENEKLREEMHSHYLATIAPRLRASYEYILDLLIEAVNNTSEISHLIPIKSRAQVSCSPWASQQKGLWVFQLRCRYNKGFGVTAADIKRILQMELDQLCKFYGFPQLLITVRLCADSMVMIYVVLASDWQAQKSAETAAAAKEIQI